jgi:hypothetical protein
MCRVWRPQTKYNSAPIVRRFGNTQSRGQYGGPGLGLDTPQERLFCYAVAVASRACIVSFKDRRGDEWSHVTAASTVFEAIRAAQAWFDDPFWKGPRPTLDTVFRITLVGDDRVWRVRAHDQSAPCASLKACPSPLSLWMTRTLSTSSSGCWAFLFARPNNNSCRS